MEPNGIESDSILQLPFTQSPPPVCYRLLKHGSLATHV